MVLEKNWDTLSETHATVDNWKKDVKEFNMGFTIYRRAFDCMESMERP